MSTRILHRLGLREHGREISAAITSVLATAAALVTLWERLDPLARLTAAAVSAAAACLYVVCRKVPAATDTRTRLPMFPRSLRRIAILGLAISCGVLALAPVLSVPAPRVERLVPIDPVAGAKLQIFGHNLPPESALALRIGADRISEIDSATPDYVVARVPEGASAGPLVVTRKRTLLPSQHAIYPITSVQNVANAVALLTEDVRQSEAVLTVLFSIVNASPHHVTVNDARLEPVLVEDLAGPRYQVERIALGVYSVLDQHAQRTTLDPVARQSIRLMDGTYTITLPPGRPASFRFQLTSPPVQHHLRLTFIIAIDFFDDTGASGRRYSNRLFAVETSDAHGIAVAPNPASACASLAELRKKYGAAVRSLGCDP